MMAFELTSSPVLLLIFNRPNTTALVMEAIRAAQPPRLYVAADGPRDRPSENERCEQARRIATDIDWVCDVQTLFRKTNLGCREAVSQGISWFFEQESDGIVLEDDCVPAPSFFRFCAELLDRYRHDERVMCITGDNFQSDMGEFPYSYYFSRYNHVWGWASWRRAWRLYDAQMLNYADFVRGGILDGLSPLKGFAEYWRKQFDEVAERRVDTWDYIWTYSCWANSGLTCTPRVNLVSNIGFGVDGTHTSDAQSRFANRAVGTIDGPLQHPPVVAAHNRFDTYVDQNNFYIGWAQPRDGTLANALQETKIQLRWLRSAAKKALPSW
jgi:hypothetical protein